MTMTTSSSRFGFRGICSVSVILSVLPLAAAAQVTPFVCRDGTPETYTVPADVTDIYVVAAGAAGASMLPKKAGAPGALVSGTLGVEPGQTLSITTGCAGRRATDITGGRGGAGY